MASLISVADAQRAILERVRPLAGEPVAVGEARGRVLAEAARSRVDLPPFPSSAMDGFAVRSADTVAAPVSLPIVFRIAAGRPAGRPLGAGEAMEISTGGVVPEGADAVVPVELVEETGDLLTLDAPVSSGANVRGRAGDVRAGDTVVEAGSELRAAQIAALAAAGVAEIVCARRPRVAIVVTGSELRRPGEPLASGEIYESNGPLLAALVEAAGADPDEPLLAGDDEDEHRSALVRALADADVLVTAGGASVGPHDLVRGVLASLGGEEVFWGVAVKPGKPTGFVMRDRTPVFTLPGNPVSVLVTFELFVRPALRALLGATDPLPRFSRGVLARPVSRNDRRHEFVRARSRRRGDVVELEPLAGQESHMIVRAGQADALVSVDAGDGELAPGAVVSYLEM